MLVLSRKEGESILIPDLNIEIRVVKLRGGRVSLGLTAPADHSIVRGELCSWQRDDGSDAGKFAAEDSQSVKKIAQYKVVSR